MFIRSAATDTLQGKAIQAVNEKWGEDFRQWGGRETIGIPVCKKKYKPFSFSVVLETGDDGVLRKRVKVERMYGCKCHSDIRKAKIQVHGERKGWEPFGQWSLRKAREMAKRETERLNQCPALSDENATPEQVGWSSPTKNKLEDSKPDSKTGSILTMCNNGSCIWKIKTKYDNIFAEIHGQSDSEDEFVT